MQKILKPIFLVLLSACGDGNFDFSEVDNSQVDSHDSSSSSGIKDPNGDLNPDCSNGIKTPNTFPFIWKPISESDRKLVIVFDKKYEFPFLFVSVFNLDGTSEDGKFFKLDDGRLGYRFDKPGSEYTGQVLVKDTGQECNAIVANPSERAE